MNRFPRLLRFIATLPARTLVTARAWRAWLAEMDKSTAITLGSHGGKSIPIGDQRTLAAADEERLYTTPIGTDSAGTLYQIAPQLIGFAAAPVVAQTRNLAFDPPVRTRHSGSRLPSFDGTLVDRVLQVRVRSGLRIIAWALLKPELPGTSIDRGGTGGLYADADTPPQLRVGPYSDWTDWTDTPGDGARWVPLSVGPEIP